MPVLPLPDRMCTPRPEAPGPTCMFLFQALYWSIRSEKLEWAV